MKAKALIDMLAEKLAAGKCKTVGHTLMDVDDKALGNKLAYTLAYNEPKTNKAIKDRATGPHFGRHGSRSKGRETLRHTEPRKGPSKCRLAD